jgi:CRP-like cAMP-binding protein
MPDYRNLVLGLLAECCADQLYGLRPVELPSGTLIDRPQTRVTHAYFLEDGMLSVTDAENEVEVACIGREGMSGVGLVLGDTLNTYGTQVRVGGTAFRLPAESIAAIMLHSAEARAILLKSARALAIQVECNALAFARGTILERLARWLLMAEDRCGPAFDTTHDRLAGALGVRRSGITIALTSLSGYQAIQVQRARVTILDHGRLVGLANGLYGTAEHEHRRLFEK